MSNIGRYDGVNFIYELLTGHQVNRTISPTLFAMAMDYLPSRRHQSLVNAYSPQVPKPTPKREIGSALTDGSVANA